MEQGDVKKLTEPDFTVSLRTVPPGVDHRRRGNRYPEITGSRSAPSSIVRGWAAALRTGATISGAKLGNGTSDYIRED